MAAMSPAELQGLHTQVLWAAFALAVLFGAIAQRTHFCTMGAVADIVNMGDWSRMRMWVLAMGVAMIGFNGMVAAGWIDAEGRLADPTFKTPEQGAATQVWAATSPALDGLGGVYCQDCDIAPIAEGNGPGVAAHSIDPDAAKRLWVLSAELTGVDAFK